MISLTDSQVGDMFQWSYAMMLHEDVDFDSQVGHMCRSNYITRFSYNAV